MARTASTFPQLATERLLLRASTAKDAAAFRALYALPPVTRFSNIPDRASAAEGDRMARWMAGLHASGRGCAWVIEVRDGKAFAGAVRFNSFERKARSGMLGYELHPDFWGRGLMSEAVAAVVACGHGAFRLNRIEAWTMTGNGASDRVLEKAGFRYEGTAREKARFKGAFHDFRMFARLAADPMP